jgi:multicomponent Na+:H+ antiporter subunit B
MALMKAKTNAPVARQAGMTLIVKVVTRLTVGLILMYGVFTALRGEDAPGAGFPAGVIIALSFIHVMLAFGREAAERKLNQARGLALASAGALIFLFFLAGGLRKAYSPAQARAFLPLTELSLAVLVGAGLFVVFSALVKLVTESRQ